MSRPVALVSLVIAAAALGCTKPQSAPSESSTAAESESAGHRHDGWWCDEHGVPEEECGQCNSKLAAAFQKRGDWCRDHDRPDSQCFVCHPEHEVAYAAKYEARTGKKPTKPNG